MQIFINQIKINLHITFTEHWDIMSSTFVGTLKNYA